MFFAAPPVNRPVGEGGGSRHGGAGAEAPHGRGEGARARCDTARASVVRHGWRESCRVSLKSDWRRESE